MFKLLTEAESSKVRREYMMRRAIVMLSALILVLVTGIIGLLPSYVLSSARQNEALERTKIISHSKQSSGGSDPQVWLTQINKELKLLSPKLDTDRPSDFINKILEKRITGLRITEFSWVKVKDGINLSISGISKDRQTLVTFENDIKSSNYFSNVTLPISNLAKDKDIDFQIKFSLSVPKSASPTP